MYQVLVQDFVCSKVDKCIGSPRDMNECNGFKLLYWEAHMKKLVKEEWFEDMRYIVKLGDNKLGI